MPVVLYELNVKMFLPLQKSMHSDHSLMCCQAKFTRIKEYHHEQRLHQCSEERTSTLVLQLVFCYICQVFPVILCQVPFKSITAWKGQLICLLECSFSCCKVGKQILSLSLGRCTWQLHKANDLSIMPYNADTFAAPSCTPERPQKRHSVPEAFFSMIDRVPTSAVLNLNTNAWNFGHIRARPQIACSWSCAASSLLASGRRQRRLLLVSVQSIAMSQCTVHSIFPVLYIVCCAVPEGWKGCSIPPVGQGVNQDTREMTKKCQCSGSLQTKRVKRSNQHTSARKAWSGGSWALRYRHTGQGEGNIYKQHELTNTHPLNNQTTHFLEIFATSLIP